MASKVLIASVLAATALVFSPMQAAAQGLPGAPIQAQPSPSSSLAFPSIFGVASAVPAPGGTAFAALSYVSPREGLKNADDDGDLSFGYAFGNPVTGVSGQVAVNILGLDPFGDSGSVSFSLSRMLRAGGSSATFATLSTGGLLGWGDASDSDTTYVAAVSHIEAFPLANGTELPVQFTVGFGSASTLSDDGQGTRHPGMFLGLGVGLTETLSGSISLTETQVNMGFSLSIPQIPGAGLSLGVYDVTDNTDRQQVALGLSLAF